MSDTVWRPASGLFAALLAAGTLAACGGGSSSDSSGGGLPLSVQVALSGPTSQTLTLAEGDDTTVAVQPGTVVTIETAGNTAWYPSAADAGYTIQAAGATSKSATVDSVVGGSVSFEVVSSADPKRKATITLEVDARAFDAGKRVVSEVAKWQQVTVPFQGESVIERLRAVVIAINADGSYESEWVSDGGSEGRVSYDKDDNVLRTSDSSGAELCRYAPLQLEYQFPLKFGNTWSGKWSAACGGIAPRDGESNFAVRRYEKVTVGAGVFDALRIDGTITHSNVTDTELPDGDKGKASYVQTQSCWWAPAIQRVVRCEVAYDFGGAKPANRPRSTVWELSALKNP
jgi:hypothetical protein